MPNYERLLRRVLSGQSGNNIRFSSLCGLLRRMGFEERIRGSHHIFYRDGIVEMALSKLSTSNLMAVRPNGSKCGR